MMMSCVNDRYKNLFKDLQEIVHDALLYFFEIISVNINPAENKIQLDHENSNTEE